MILMDGAMGTYLMSLGIPADACFEALNLTRPDLVRKVHRRYAAAGAKILVANTFGANRVRLGPWAGKLSAINQAGVRLARKAAPKALVLGSIGPLGPAGQALGIKRKQAIFREQARALAQENPDGLLVETMTSVAEAVDAVTAARSVFPGAIGCLLAPVKAFQGRSPNFYLKLGRRLRAAGADLLGTNCGTGPTDALELFRALKKAGEAPFCARPADGASFVAAVKAFEKLGCSWFGGCCGTTPATTRLISGCLGPS